MIVETIAVTITPPCRHVVVDELTTNGFDVVTFCRECDLQDGDHVGDDDREAVDNNNYVIDDDYRGDDDEVDIGDDDDDDVDEDVIDDNDDNDDDDVWWVGRWRTHHSLDWINPLFPHLLLLLLLL